MVYARHQLLRERGISAKGLLRDVDKNWSQRASARFVKNFPISEPQFAGSQPFPMESPVAYSLFAKEARARSDKLETDTRLQQI